MYITFRITYEGIQQRYTLCITSTLLIIVMLCYKSCIFVYDLYDMTTL